MCVCVRVCVCACACRCRHWLRITPHQDADRRKRVDCLGPYRRWPKHVHQRLGCRAVQLCLLRRCVPGCSRLALGQREGHPGVSGGHVSWCFFLYVCVRVCWCLCVRSVCLFVCLCVLIWVDEGSRGLLWRIRFHYVAFRVVLGLFALPQKY